MNCPRSFDFVTWRAEKELLHIVYCGAFLAWPLPLLVPAPVPLPRPPSTSPLPVAPPLQIFNSRLVLASPQTATDADYTAIEGVVAHEVREGEAQLSGQRHPLLDHR